MFRAVVVAGVGVLVACSFVGCTKRNPAVCCTTEADCERSGLPTPTQCEDALVCLSNTCQLPPTCQADSDCSGSLVCDVADGVCVACLDSSMCGDKVCDPETHSCRACQADAECPGGFCSTASMTCRSSIIPRLLPTACDSTSPTSLVFSSDMSIDTSDDAACTGGILKQSGSAPEVCMFHAHAIFVEASATLSFHGPRAVAIVADTAMTIAGTVDIDAHATVSGPGGGTRVSGGEAETAVGGGGAGFSTYGGAGATTDVTGGAQNGGDLYKVSVLSGGPRAAGANGGGGGGGLTMIACRSRLTVTGVLSANGGGAALAPGGMSGFGGGAGGYIALQGRAVSVIGRAFANGGSGSSGATLTSLPSWPGIDGHRSSTTCALSVGDGGDGNCLAAPPGDGRIGGATLLPGGGGGSVGEIQAFAAEDMDVSPRDASPQIDASTVLETR